MIITLSYARKPKMCMLRKCHKNLIKKARMTFRKKVYVIYKKSKLKKDINNIYIIYACIKRQKQAK